MPPSSIFSILSVNFCYSIFSNLVTVTGILVFRNTVVKWLVNLRERLVYRMGPNNPLTNVLRAYTDARNSNSSIFCYFFVLFSLFSGSTFSFLFYSLLVLLCLFVLSHYISLLFLIYLLSLKENESLYIKAS